MGSVRDPGTAAMEAAERQRAALSVAQTRRQASARRDREHRLAGSTAARRELAEDFAALTRTGRAVLPVSQVPPLPRPTPEPEPTGDLDFFQGEGPPPDVIPGAGPGDTYLDTISGDIYELE